MNLVNEVLNKAQKAKQKLYHQFGMSGGQPFNHTMSTFGLAQNQESV